MKVCVPVTADGQVDPRWGRADRVAVAEVAGGEVRDWQEYTVAWGTLHIRGPRVLIMPGWHGSCGITGSRRSAFTMWGLACSACSGSMAIRVVTGLSGDARSAARAAG